MRLGVPTEIKPDDYRVALTPAGVRELVGRGHEVLVQGDAGLRSGTFDTDNWSQGSRSRSDLEANFCFLDAILKARELSW